MKRWLIAGSITLTLICAGLFAAQINGYFDFLQIATPSNPATGSSRVYVDSTAHQLKCLNPDGSSCAPSGGGGNTISSGAYGSQPLSPATGDLYIATNSPYQQLWGGASWKQIIFGRQVTPPTLAGFSTWLNQGPATEDDSLGGIYVYAPPVSGQNCRVIVKTAPAAPCTVTVGAVYGGGIVDFGGGGLGFRNSGTGQYVEAMYFNNGNRALVAQQWTNPTSAAGTPITRLPFMAPTVIWLRLQDDGTDRTYWYSMDGVHFIQYYTESNTTFISSFDQIVLDTHSENSSVGTGIWWFEYYETTP